MAGLCFTCILQKSVVKIPTNTHKKSDLKMKYCIAAKASRMKRTLVFVIIKIVFN